MFSGLVANPKKKLSLSTVLIFSALFVVYAEKKAELQEAHLFYSGFVKAL